MTNDDAPKGWLKRQLVDMVAILDSQRIPINNKERQERLAATEKRFPYYGATGQVGDIDDFIFDGEAVLLGEDAAPFLEPNKAKAYLVSGKFWVNNHAHILRGTGAMDNAFLCHQLNVLNYQGFVSGTTRLKLTQASMKELPLWVPPFNEQQRIVEKIETLFAQLDKGEEAVREVQKLLTRYRQSVLKAAVTGQLTADWRAERAGQLEHGRDLLARIVKSQSDGWEGPGKYAKIVDLDSMHLPELPTGWVWASIGQLAKIMGGLTKNSKRGELPLRRPMLRVANVYQNRLELDDIHQTGVTEGELARVLLEPRDILVVEGNGSKDQIGRMAVWSGEIPDAVHQNHLIKVRLHEKLLAEFLISWFQSLLGRQVVEKVASSTSGLYTLSISKIASMVAPLPSLEEAIEIRGQVEEAHSKIAVLEEWCETELNRSASLRQSILKDAFAGKLVPQDPADELASALLARIAAEKIATKNPRRKVRA